ncbi:MAG TPA: CDP-alcohol phosphatidyltransferase family protein [Egibacteraceae bacterium]|nr:CDP-alcohol phosphatidyltransferase family protein [Egibacteraceae bacterium]
MGLFNAGARSGAPAVVHDRILTVANGITAVRLLGLPVFVYLAAIGAYGRAFGTLVLVGATDWVDGYVARRFDQVTRIGKLIDPLIDRALLATAAITMLVLGIIPWWVPALIIVRDVALLLAAFVLFRGANPNIPVSNLGKFATACLLIGVPAFLLAHPTADWPGARVTTVIAYGYCIVGIVTYYVAGWRYGRMAMTVRRALREGHLGEAVQR